MLADGQGQLRKTDPDVLLTDPNLLLTDPGVLLTDPSTSIIEETVPYLLTDCLLSSNTVVHNNVPEMMTASTVASLTRQEPPM